MELTSEEIIEMLKDEYKKGYEKGYADARDKYEKQENPIQMFRRSGHP